jgi:hypothetical protein
MGNGPRRAGFSADRTGFSVDGKGARMLKEQGKAGVADANQLDRWLNDIGWGLLFMLTGLVWMVPSQQVPEGTWLFGVAAILIGVNVVRYLKHLTMSSFSLVLGFLALLAAVGQLWRVDLPLLAICLFVIGASLVVKPLLTRVA